MPASSFDKRNISTSRQPWRFTFAPGAALTNLFALYPSKGNITIDVETSIPSLLDGPIQVARYGDLTVNDTLTVTNRCRGLLLLCDSLTMGEAGVISMTARGAAGNRAWANQDIGIPTSVALSGENTSRKDFFSWLAETGYFVGDPTLFKCPLPGMGDVIADWSAWPSKMAVIVSADGCGAGANSSLASGHGVAGGAGTNAPGGGGSGAGNGLPSIPGAPARVWGGGSASGGNTTGTYDTVDMIPDLYGGIGGAGNPAATIAGGGAGNPGGAAVGTGGIAGGTGTGGILIIVARGAVTLTSGHAFTAAGADGGAGNSGGAGSGGGRVALFYGSTLAGTANMTTNGGALGGSLNATYNGAPGGDGATSSETFSAMGWV